MVYNSHYTTNGMKDPKVILKQIGLTDSEISVYLAMAGGRTKARDILKSTGEKRPTMYYALSSLEKRGLIGKQKVNGEYEYILESPERLEILVQEKKKDIDSLLSEVQSLIPDIQSNDRGIDDVPSMTFFEGKKAIKIIIMESLYCKSGHIETIIPEENYFLDLGRHFAAEYVDERIRRNITTKNLWTFEIDKPTLSTYYEKHSEVRVLPPVMKDMFKTSVMIYDDTVLYISSLRSGYCIKITAAEHADMMRAIFQGLWGVSVPHS